MQHDISYYTAGTEVVYKSEFESTKDTPYLALTGELWGVYCEEFEENWPCYNSAALYSTLRWIASLVYMAYAAVAARYCTQSSDDLTPNGLWNIFLDLNVTPHNYICRSRGH